MADEEYHTMEMSRRSIRISDMREELRDIREREAEAQERLDQLDRQISSKKVHISICKANAQGMEDQAAADEVLCLQNQRLMQEDEEAVQTEAQDLNEKLAKTAKSLEKAQAEAIEAQKAVEAQKEANKRAAEEAATQAAKLAERAETTAAAEANVERVQETIKELEVTLGMEKKACTGLQDQVTAEEEKRQETQVECDRLSELLESLSSRGPKEELSKALAAVQREHLQLTQELATQQREGLIKQQDMQGRLDETRRISRRQSEDSVDIPRTAEKEKQDVKVNASGPVPALMASLEEEKKKVETVKATRIRLEAEAKGLEKELADLQRDQRESEDKEDKQSAGLEELRSAQEKLDTAKRQLREKDEALQVERGQLTQTRQNARVSLEVLRAKLKELWIAVEKVKG